MPRPRLLLLCFILAASGISAAPAALPGARSLGAFVRRERAAGARRNDVRGLHALIAREGESTSRNPAPAPVASGETHRLSAHDREVLRRQILEQSQESGGAPHR